MGWKAGAIGLAALAALVATPAFGTMIASEDFSSYTVGVSLEGLGTASGGWAGSWYAGTTGPGWWSAANYVVATPAHTFSPDYTSPANGQTAGGGFQRLFRQLSAPTSATAPTYVSFIGPAKAMSEVDLNMAGLNPSNSNGDDDSNRVAAFQWAGSSNDTIKLEDGTVPVGTSPFTITMGQTSASAADLYVIKLDPTTGTVGYYVFLNGTSPISGTASYGLVETNNATRGAQFDRFGLFSINSLGVSDIRIGTTAADVGVSDSALVGAPIPEPASLGLLAMGGLALLRRRRK